MEIITVEVANVTIRVKFIIDLLMVHAYRAYTARGECHQLKVMNPLLSIRVEEVATVSLRSTCSF